MLLDPSLAGLETAVTESIGDAAAAGATLVLAFVGHAETLPSPLGGVGDLYLLPHDGAVPPTSKSGYLLGQRVNEELGTVGGGLDGLLLLVDACHSGVGALDVVTQAGAMVAASKTRLEMVAATFTRTARDGCFSLSLTDLISHGLPGLSADYLDGGHAVDNAADTCRAQEPPLRLAMTQDDGPQGTPACGWPATRARAGTGHSRAPPLGDTLWS